jgi:hypothetical protein
LERGRRGQWRRLPPFSLSERGVGDQERNRKYMNNKNEGTKFSLNPCKFPNIDLMGSEQIGQFERNWRILRRTCIRLSETVQNQMEFSLFSSLSIKACGTPFIQFDYDSDMK